jgi:hypothetical protein
MNTDVTISDDLKAMLAKCKPGQSKPISVTAAMDKDGKVTLSSAETSEEYTEEKPAPKKKAGSSRPKPVMAALGMM